MTRVKLLQRIIKRCFDLFLSFLLLIALSPLFALIAIVIRVLSGAPILYRWQVVGIGGQPFTGWKFRTMIVGADRVKQELIERNEMRGPVFKIKDDPRVTPVGRVLRKFSLDELPQLWSVLKGDMSLVGPRPALQSEYGNFSEWQRQKFAMRPGMTSLWHANGKPKDFDEWVRLDLEYIENWSLWLDFKILFQTAIVVLLGKNY